MIARDRELLARAATVNREFGGVVAKMMADQDNGQLPPDDLQRVGQALSSLGAEFLALAAERGGRTVETPKRVIIDAQVAS